MKRRGLYFFFNPEFAVAAILVLAMSYALRTVSNVLSAFNIGDETSWLYPIANRIDFLNVQDLSLDAIFATRDMRDADRRIVVVNVGEVGPTPDGKIALLLDKLRRLRARAVGIDVFFDREHFERFPPERAWEIAALKEALARMDNVVVVDGYDPETLKPTIFLDPDILRLTRDCGFANLEKDDDDVVRRFRPSIARDGAPWLSFPLAVARVCDSNLVAPFLRASADEDDVISYTGTYQQFQTAPIDDVIADTRYDDLLRGAVVLIGFVNERGLVYLGDTHKTPMGHKTVVTRPDGTTTLGVDGPDMAGILIHANVLNMLLTGTAVRPVPLWFDCLLTALFSYICIAVYRSLRTRVASQAGVGALITAMIVVLTIFVFFLPLIAFFYFGWKIAYDLPAVAVLLFIPTNAFTTKIRFRILRRRVHVRSRLPSAFPAQVVVRAFEDPEPLAAYIRLIHASLFAVHFATVAAAFRRRLGAVPFSRPVPLLDDWAASIGAIARANASGADPTHRLFFRYLEGKKDEFLHDARLKHLMFSSEAREANEFFYLDEWEALLPHALRLFRTDLAPELAAAGVVGIEAMFPWIVDAECKVHRHEERFVYAALVRRQYEIESVPVYYGTTVVCEPILPREAVARIRGTRWADIPLKRHDHPQT